MSITPKRVEDASRILRGLMLVAAQAAANSGIVRQIAALEKEASSRAQERVTARAASLSQGLLSQATTTNNVHTVEPALQAASARVADGFATPNVTTSSSKPSEVLHVAYSAIDQYEIQTSTSRPSSAMPHVTIETNPGAGMAVEDGEQLFAVGSPAKTSTQLSLAVPNIASDVMSSSTNAGAVGAVLDPAHDHGQRSSAEFSSATTSSSVPQVPSNATLEASSSTSEHAKLAAASTPVNNVELSSATVSTSTSGSTAITSSVVGPRTPTATTAATPVKRQLREAAVPSTSIGRAFGFAGLGANLLYGAMRDSVSRYLRPQEETSSKGAYSAFLSDKNAEILANALCRMRGAALKLGQMLSIQDENLLPPQWHAALERVRAGADVMPRHQLEGVMRKELGDGWHNLLAEFDFTPSAAASIGQVHKAMTLDGRAVAMKVQYPGVARSIKSDVDNLMRLIRVANIFPPGLYVEAAARVAKQELAMECDYARELEGQRRFRELITSDPFTAQHFNVPDVFPELSTSAILTTEWVPGVHVDKCTEYPQDVRDAIGTRLLSLTLKELFDWRFMQTDPNWGNFLYDKDSDKLHLIDFGAAREYPKSFVDDYLRMVLACAHKDQAEVIHRSQRLGFLTGDESELMLGAHTQAGFMVGTPFATEGMYDFASHNNMTKEVTEMGKVMLQHRLTPPPEESYSLHRKLSGAFLACIKIKAVVPARDLLLETYNKHEFGAT